jgi:hypothetical protein
MGRLMERVMAHVDVEARDSNCRERELARGKSIAIDLLRYRTDLGLPGRYYKTHRGILRVVKLFSSR